MLLQPQSALGFQVEQGGFSQVLFGVAEMEKRGAILALTLEEPTYMMRVSCSVRDTKKCMKDYCLDWAEMVKGSAELRWPVGLV